MIESAVLPKVMDLVAARASDLSDVIVGALRQSFPGIHFSICSDEDIPPRLTPAAGNPYCELYYVDSGGHCLRLTNDPEAATGLVVALREWD